MLHIIKNYRELFLGLVETNFENKGNWANDEAQAAALGIDLASIGAIIDGKTKESHQKGMVTIERKNTKERVSTIQDSQEQQEKLKFDMLLNVGKGSEKKKVETLQLLLSKYNPGPVDGLWGTKTLAALHKFQKAHGLRRTNTVSRETVKAFDTDLNEAPKQTVQRIPRKSVERKGIKVTPKYAQGKIKEAQENRDYIIREFKDCPPEEYKELVKSAREQFVNNKKYWSGMVWKMKGSTKYDTTWWNAVRVIRPCVEKAKQGKPCTPAKIKREAVKLIPIIKKQTEEIKNDCDPTDVFSYCYEWGWDGGENGWEGPWSDPDTHDGPDVGVSSSPDTHNEWAWVSEDNTPANDASALGESHDWVNSWAENASEWDGDPANESAANDTAANDTSSTASEGSSAEWNSWEANDNWSDNSDDNVL